MLETLYTNFVYIFFTNCIETIYSVYRICIIISIEFLYNLYRISLCIENFRMDNEMTETGSDHDRREAKNGGVDDFLTGWSETSGSQ